MKYESFELENGLKVVVHEDHTTRVAVLNLIYNVGSKDEDPNKTGFAHLFEHLMFGGSKNINEFDSPLQKVGGENNAFTNADYTNYYMTVPSSNLETAFWLESDRMLSLSFDPKVLEIQRKVVIEEFKQRYLNQPYGDVWLKLRPTAFQSHPYMWPTIGKEISHIEDATMSDVKDFFYKYYIPNNAVLVVAGDVHLDDVKRLSEKWFGPIEPGKPYKRDLPTESIQQEARQTNVEADVPMNAIYKAYHMPERLSAAYYSSDLLSDILGHGKSSRLYTSLVKEKRLMNSANAYITGSIDPGLFVVSGRLTEGVGFDEVEQAIEEEVNSIVADGVSNQELQKVIAQSESSHLFGEIEVLNRAMNLAYFTNLGNTEWINEEIAKIGSVTREDVNDRAKKMLSKLNCSTLYYHKK